VTTFSISPTQASQFLPRRASDYFSSMIPYGTKSFTEPMRLTMDIIRQQDIGRTNTTVATFSGFYVQQMTFVDSEMTDQIVTAEAEKLYVSDRHAPPNLSLGGFVYDTDVTIQGPNGEINERTRREWDAFYELGRASAVLRANRLVRIQLLEFIFLGMFASNALTHTSGAPHRYDLAVAFLCMDVIPIKQVELIQGTDVVGKLTMEGADIVGLLRSNLSTQAEDRLLSSDPLTKTALRTSGSFEA
jgi:hypothetical protein